MRRLLAILLHVVLSALASSAHSQWQFNGVGICAAANSQVLPQIIPDGAGGAFVTWYDYRNGLNTSYDIYLQRVDASGSSLWAGDGVALCTAADTQAAPRIAPDGAGGAIVVWMDARSGDYDIHAQRVDPSGNALWTFDGVAICTAAISQVDPVIVPDGAGGAIVAWHDYRSGADSDIYAQRVDASGVPQWTPDGIAVCASANDQLNLAIASDGAGGAVVAWQDLRSASSYIVFAQRVNASGTPMWTAGGKSLGSQVDGQVNPTIVADGAGGAIVTWNGYPGLGLTGIYAQRVDASGGSQWTAGGAVVALPANGGSLPTITSDGAGGAIITWQELNGGQDIQVQRLNAFGVPQWTPGGVALCVATDDQLSPRIVADGAGGAIVAWYDARSGGETNYNLYAQKVDASGVPQWVDDGIALCTAGGNQSDPMIASDGAGGALITWQDSRYGNSDIYLSIANGNTPAGTNIVVTPIDVTTGGTPVTVTFDDVGDGSTSLATGPTGPALPGSFTSGDGLFYNLSTTATFSGNVEVCITYNESALTVPESSVRLIHYDATLFDWVDITTSLNTGLNRVCGVTTSLSPFVIGAGGATAVGGDLPPPGFALHQNAPNPFNPTTVIAFEVPAHSWVRLSIHDVAGRRVRSLVDQRLAAGTHSFTWDGRDDAGRELASGIYFYRVQAGVFGQTREMVLLK